MGSPLLGIRQSTHRWSAKEAPENAQSPGLPHGPAWEATRWNPATSPRGSTISAHLANWEPSHCHPVLSKLRYCLCQLPTFRFALFTLTTHNSPFSLKALRKWCPPDQVHFRAMSLWPQRQPGTPWLTPRGDLEGAAQGPEKAVFGGGQCWGLTKAGGTVQGHVPDHPGAEAGPHQEELLGHFPQGPLSLGGHLRESE